MKSKTALFLLFFLGHAHAACPEIPKGWEYQRVQVNYVITEGSYGVYLNNGIAVAAHVEFHEKTKYADETTFFDRNNGDCVRREDRYYSEPYSGETTAIMARTLFEFRFQQITSGTDYANVDSAIANQAKAILKKGYRIRALFDKNGAAPPSCSH